MAGLVRWFLFQTKTGEWLLEALERWAGICIVQADWLGAQPACAALKTTSE